MREWFVLMRAFGVYFMGWDRMTYYYVVVPFVVLNRAVASVCTVQGVVAGYSLEDLEATYTRPQRPAFEIVSWVLVPPTGPKGTGPGPVPRQKRIKQYTPAIRDLRSRKGASASPDQGPKCTAKMLRAEGRMRKKNGA